MKLTHNKQRSIALFQVNTSNFNIWGLTILEHFEHQQKDLNLVKGFEQHSKSKSLMVYLKTLLHIGI